MTVMLFSKETSVLSALLEAYKLEKELTDKNTKFDHNVVDC